ncbi:N-acetyltransferase [uncultured Bifidobacterium sp.]|uniref:N-acetyltransferase n=1 Tax=uncultured Bifidobacterium sp. TaxID=165187 RepID=UPI0028DB83BA|nr:N-acetyltransferase [uncultured Bifidobacterium sp.]
MRPAAADDLTRMLATLARARRLMAAAGNPTQWGTVFPRRSTVEEDIRLGRAFLLVDDGEDGRERLLAQFALCEGRDPSYASIDGAWLDDDPYVAVHRLASSGLRPRSARTCLEWILGSHPNVRIDTHRNNHAMRHILAGLGFAFCGTILLPDHDEDPERLAFQRHDG